MCQPSNIFVVASAFSLTAVQWSVGALRMWKLAGDGGLWGGWGGESGEPGGIIG